MGPAGLANDWEMLGLGRFTSAAPWSGVATGQWYRLITSAFLPPPGFSNLGPPTSSSTCGR